MDRPDFQPIAEIEVDEVSPEPGGFTLAGQGPDRAEYRLAVHFGMPLDARTRQVLGELLSHSELTISRRGPRPAAASTAPRRARAPR